MSPVLPQDLDPVYVRASALLAADEFDPSAALCVCGTVFDLHPTGSCAQFDLDPAFDLAVRALAADERTLMQDVGEHSDAQREARLTGGWTVGPSDYGKCRRSIWYRENPPEGYEPLPEDKRKANVGTAVHTGGTVARSAMYPWRRYAMRIPIPGLDRDGEIDEYDPVLLLLDDWKTAGDPSWILVGRQGAFAEAIGQIEIYGLALEEAGYPVQWLRARYINRNTGEEETFEWPYDRRVAEEKLATLIQVVTALDAGVELPRDRSGPHSDKICQLCPALRHCWNLDLADELERSGESVTVLGEEPTDESLEWAAQELHDANVAYAAAEERREKAKALIDGLPPQVLRRVGLEIYRGWAGHGTDWQHGYERAAALWPMAEINRPADPPPAPRRRPKPYTQVRALRVAETKPKSPRKKRGAKS